MSTRVASLSHTADVGFRVEADTAEELFSGAARGLVASLLGREPDGDRAGPPGEEEQDRAEARATERWTISRPDRERLLVAWLREILHRAQADGLLPVDTSVRLGEGPSLQATVTWRNRDRRGELVREIKGVTYHGLEVGRDDDGWRARVVLDV